MKKTQFAIENVRNKTMLWILVTVLIVAVVLAVVFLTNPTDKIPPDGTYPRAGCTAPPQRECIS